jgi:hypothetical protein
MNRRPLLRDKLRSVLEPYGASDNVYFQPPESIKLEYPCIIYQLEYIFTRRADNGVYTRQRRYEITIIDKNPDSELPDRLIDILPNVSNRNYFANDGLYHTVFSLYW